MSSNTAASILVSCFCAEWCSSCREYRETFRRVEQQYPDVRFLWIDIEDQPDLIGDISVEDFPTVMIAAGAEPRFFGPLTPQPEVLTRLVSVHRTRTDGVALADHQLLALVARLREASP
jgi:thioredoxin 1